MQLPCSIATHARRAALMLACLALAVQATPVQAATALTHDDVAWLQRAGFGLDSVSMARYQQLGRTRFLDDELAGNHDTLPAAISAMIQGYDIINTPTSQLLADYRQQRLQLKQAPDDAARDAAKKVLQRDRRKIYLQDAQIEALHAIYGGNQLKEQMVWFWLNHFSLYAAKGNVRLFAASFEDNAIRPHALGKFRELVMATLKSPAMLEYLDNARNIQGKTNENYARELMELHTLGVGAGYTQQDVQQLALILTGAGVAPPRQLRFAGSGLAGGGQPGFVRDGDFVFNPRKHDASSKTFLGHTIKGGGYEQIEQAVTLITRQPACAQFVSGQLAEYFVADKPPASLVKAMAATFQRTDGDIAAVLRTMFLSPALTASYGRKFKDPTQFMVSAMRLAYDGQPISNALPLVNWLNQMGEPPYGRITPDGWPLDSVSWSGSGQMAKRFDVARAIGSGYNRLFMADGDSGKPHPAAPDIRHSAVYRSAIAPYLSAATRAALDKAASPMEWNTFLLSSPDFNYR